MNWFKIWLVTLFILFVGAVGSASIKAEVTPYNSTPYQLTRYCFQIGEFARTTVKVRDLGMTQLEYVENMIENASKYSMDDDTLQELIEISNEVYSNPDQTPDDAFEFYLLKCSHPRDAI